MIELTLEKSPVNEARCGKSWPCSGLPILKSLVDPRQCKDLSQIKVGSRLSPGGGAVRAEQPLPSRESQVTIPRVHCEALGKPLGCLGSASDQGGSWRRRVAKGGPASRGTSAPLGRGRAGPRKAMANRAPLPLTFEDVAIYFTEQEWQNLEVWQKELYQHVMRTNYQTLVSLDDRIPKPELISWIEQGGDPFRNWEEAQTSENKICSSAHKHFDPVIEGQLFGGSQKAVHSEEIKCHFQLDPQQDIHRKQRHFQNNDREKRFCLKSKLKAQPRRYIRKKRFFCSECGQAFVYPCKLRDHMRVHSGEKPFQCPECNKCFRLKGTLKTHQHIHRRERGFYCGECGKGFIFMCKLDDHIRVHRKSCSVPNEPVIRKRFSQPYAMVEDDWS
ncbi:uncharacterized protein LOC143679754 [Tamandua tetradactyla]|uniref:uncharacterized protein LOC143679754 n=1 Tax=Tamandua tetradactyla TaxID=48850 RepID=UPI0040543B7A